MKQIILFLLSINIINSFSQSGNVTDYLPLQVGNVWVYQHSSSGYPPCFCNKKIKVKVTGTSSYNGKTYFRSQVSTMVVSCPTSCDVGFLQFDSLLRVDTASGKILMYALGTGCITPNETLIDSLKSHLHDTIWAYCEPPASYRTYTCTDTSGMTVFGISRQTKRFLITGGEGGWERTYAKGIGMVSSNCYMLMCYGNSQLIGCLINGVVYGDTSLTAVYPINSEVPMSFSLYQNYPNPFNPSTALRFQIPSDGFVKLTVYDAIGREVSVLVNEQLKPGTYEVEWNAADLPSGIYFYKLEVNTLRPDKSGHPSQEGNYTETKKMVLIK